MLATRLNYCIERAVILFICLWGSWALYYWVMVLVFDASFTELRAYTPVLLLQIVATILVFLRTDLGISQSSTRLCTPGKVFSLVTPSKRFVLLTLLATVLAIVAVYFIDAYKLTKSSLHYNLFWAALLPVSFAYLTYFKTPEPGPAPLELRAASKLETFDILLPIIAGAVLVYNLHGIYVPTFDDAFYVHVISSTLANPELPVQGQDLLLNTGAPYTLHPAYRGVGYEILITLLSDLSGLDPFVLNYELFPCVSAVFWLLAAYLFMRMLGTPYPGLAVTVSVLLLLFWSGRFAPGMPLGFLNWGKNLLILVAAPLIFVFVSVYVRSRSLRTWALLFLAVSALGILSSTALFLLPVCVGLACIVFLAPTRANVRTLFLALLTLAPIFLLMGYTVFVLHQSPANTSGGNAGALAVQGEAFGGLPIKALLLLMLLVLPVAARTIGNVAFQVNLYKIANVGMLTLMAPFLVEMAAIVSGTHFLSVRLQFAYPTMLMVGILASILMAQLKPYAGVPARKRTGFALFAVAVVFYGTLIGYMEKRYLFGEWRIFMTLFTDDFEEAKAVRALIPDGAYVAAGDMDDILPILPNPPSFTESKFYLSFHKNFLTEEEFRNRSKLQRTLQIRLPRQRETLEDSWNWVVSTAESLGVTTIVYHTLGGRHRPYIITVGIPDRNAEMDAKVSAYVAGLTEHLRAAGYDCVATPSDRSRVCNRSL